jgi:predicted Zn-dependent protease
MKKTVFQFLILFLLFTGSFFLLSQLPFTQWLHIPEWTSETEKKWGDLCLEFFTRGHKQINDKEIEKPIQSILKEICEANQIDYHSIQFHIVEHDEINAFALPDRHLIVYTSLITGSEDQRALAGVLAHELAHIELHHVSKKLIKELGTSLLVGLSGSQAGTIIKEVAHTLSSSAYDRKLEKEADLKAVEYLKNCKVDPTPFAVFLENLSEGSTINLSWMETHPDSKERGKYIRAQIGSKKTLTNELISKASWEGAQEALIQKEFAPLDSLDIPQ